MKEKRIYPCIAIFISSLFFIVPSVIAVDDDLFSNGIVADNVRGLIKPVERAVISSEVTAKINKIPFKSGERFKKGDLLVDFDCSYYRAALASSEAEYQSKKSILKNNKELLALNAMSEIDVSISESEMQVARADRTMRAIRVSQCKIKAPYSGRVIEVTVNEHEVVSEEEQEVLSILNDSKLEIELIVPSNWLTWLSVDESFTFLIDETGMTLNAKVIKMGAVVDPVSQTIKLTGRFEEEIDGVLSGMSGTAQFKQENN
jgi:membrane fusion protein, multidrug efflux system